MKLEAELGPELGLLPSVAITVLSGRAGSLLLEQKLWGSCLRRLHSPKGCALPCSQHWHPCWVGGTVAGFGGGRGVGCCSQRPRLLLMCHLCEGSWCLPRWVWAAFVSHGWVLPLAQGTPVSKVELCREGRRAGAVSQIRLLRWQGTGACLWSFNLPCLRNKQEGVCSSWVESRLLSALVSPAGPLTSRRDRLPRVGSQDWGVQHVARTTHWPERLSAHVISLLLCVFSSFYNKHYIFREKIIIIK